MLPVAALAATAATVGLVWVYSSQLSAAALAYKQALGLAAITAIAAGSVSAGGVTAEQAVTAIALGAS